MNKLLIITPVKDSIDTFRATAHSVMLSNINAEWEYVVYDDFSSLESSNALDLLADELNFEVVHLCNIISTPSPNYRYVLQQVQLRALEMNAHLVIVESDVVVKPDTMQRLLDTVSVGVGMVAAVTVDDDDRVNFPYLYAKNFKTKVMQTTKRLSFCCTLLSVELLSQYSFLQLDPSKAWYDVTISHQSNKLRLKNLLDMTNRVLHRPHSSRPWKLLKYTNPLKYYWLKYTKGLDKI